MSKRILTGDRPTGPLHLGHYVGSLKKRIELQDEYDTFVLIADVQALTDNFENPSKISDNIYELALDYLACGLDPNKVKIVVQSKISAIAELTIFYANLVTLTRLERNPTLKDEIKQKNFERTLPVGFLIYPISQAADITAFEADLVPVGEDQLPMIEQTTEIVRRFNRLYGNVLVEPKAMVGTVPRLCGTDGKAKMGKSLGNTINLSDSKEIVQKKVMSMYTDPSRIHQDDPGAVEGNPVFIYHDAFNSDKSEVLELKKRYETGTVGDVEVKEKLARVLNDLLDPIREKRIGYQKNMSKVKDIIITGTESGNKIANATLAKVKNAMKINYF